MTNTSHHSEFNPGPLTNGKLAFLGVVTFALAATQALVPLAPVPLAMAILLYGHRSGAVVTILCFTCAYLLTMFFPTMTSVMASIFLIALVAFCVAQTIFAKVHPVIGLVKSGLGIFGLFLLIGLIISLLSQGGLRGQVENVVYSMIEAFLGREENQRFLESGQSNAVVLSEFVDNPEKLVNNIMNWSFGVVFVSIFLAVWMSLFLTLRNSMIWRQHLNYTFGLDDLVKFRMPDQAVWPLIVGLVLFVGSGHILPEFFAVLGGNLLICLAVFYFFQGFGLYYDVLTHYKMIGFFRSILVVTAVVFAWEILVFAGVFDMWINFRKFLKSNNIDKGDM